MIETGQWLNYAGYALLGTMALGLPLGLAALLVRPRREPGAAPRSMRAHGTSERSRRAFAPTVLVLDLPVAVRATRRKSRSRVAAREA